MSSRIRSTRHSLNSNENRTIGPTSLPRQSSLSSHAAIASAVSTPPCRPKQGEGTRFMALLLAHSRSQRLHQLQQVVFAERTDQFLDCSHGIDYLFNCHTIACRFRHCRS
jgi:hypothetical protein